MRIPNPTSPDHMCVSYDLHVSYDEPILLLIHRDERPRIRAVQIDKLKRYVGYQEMDKVLNAQIREL